MAGLPELHRAVKRQDIGAVRTLLRAGADPNVKAAGKTPLMFAAKLSNTRIIRLLLDAGAKPNVTGPGDWTPLAVAASTGSYRAVALLLESGADPRQPFGHSTVRDYVQQFWPERRKIISLLDSALAERTGAV